MSYDKLVEALRCCSTQTCDYMGMGWPGCAAGLAHDAADAIEALQAEVADKDHLIQEQTYEIQRLRADVKRQQEKMIELAKKLPKRGEWLNVTDSYSWYGKCSVCGEEFVVDAYYAGGMNHCPNCGAKMTGEQDVE